MARLATLFLSLLFLYAPGYAQNGAPPDVGSLELLIDRHKKQYNALKERNNREIQHNAITKLKVDITTKYEKLHKDLMNKYALASQWFNLGINALSLFNELNELRKALPPFLENANRIYNPYVLLKYIQAGKKISAEIDFCVQAVTVLPAYRMNAKELYELSELIKEHVYRIRDILQSYARLIQGQIDYNRMFGKPKLPDYARIANEVIQEYYKKDQ